MRYYVSGLLLVVCFGIGWKVGRDKAPPSDVDLNVHELSIELGDFNQQPDREEEPWSDISPGLLGKPVRRS